MKTGRIILGLLIAGAVRTCAEQTPIVLENSHVRYSISPEGKNLGFVDRATGVNYLRGDGPSPCAIVLQNGQKYPATAVSFAEGRLTMRFEKAGVEAVIRVEPSDSYIRLVVDSV